MRVFNVWTLALISLLFTPMAEAQSSWSSEPMVDVALIADVREARPGDTIQLALHQRIEPGWHTYWINPGDSGEPTRLELDLPEGFEVGEWGWPTPKAYDLGPLTNYGYSDEVVLSQSLTLPEDAPLGPITLHGQASWLVCEEICIPEESPVSLTFVIGEERIESDQASLIARYQEKLPQPMPAPTGMDKVDGTLVLSIANEALAQDSARAVETVFFPYMPGVINHDSPQQAVTSDEGIQINMVAGWKVSDQLDQGHAGIIIQSFEDGRRKAYHIEPELGLPLPVMEISDFSGEDLAARTDALGSAQVVELDSGGMSFLTAAVLALLGGLLLNLMPCVFPILSMKALNLLHKRHAERSEARLLGLLFGLGVISTFLALGAILLALRTMGLPGLWGFQLQVPFVVAGLSVLIFLIGLNFLGLFEVGTSLQNIGQGQQAKSGRGGAFLTGVLAVFVAAPCVAPVMTGALVFALSQPVWASLVIFAFLGLGLALPFVLVSFVPQLLKALPKPGAWMDVFKQALAFPMFATAIWLAWVLSVQTGSMGTLLILGLFLLTSFAIWTLRFKGLFARFLTILAFLGVIAGIAATARLQEAASSPVEAGYEAWSPERVQTLRAEGRAIFIDFTAAWCVNCQVNKLTVLSTDPVKTAFAEGDVALLRADFTNRDDTIAAALEQYGAPGVPLYVMYPADGGEAEILPTLLSKDGVIQAVNRAVN